MSNNKGYLKDKNGNVLYNNIYNITTDAKEVKCDYTVDNSPVYVKRIKIDSLPDTSSITVDVGLPHTQYQIIEINGIIRSNSNNYFTIPSTGAAENRINISATGILTLTTANGNLVNGGYARVNIYYIKV